MVRYSLAGFLVGLILSSSFTASASTPPAPLSLTEQGTTDYSTASSWDYSLAAGSRSVPFGASLSAELGRGILLWGRAPLASGEFLYGYVRPLTRVRTSGITNRAEVALQVNPISFFTLEGGAGGGYRFSRTLDTQDCTSLQCSGSLQTAFFRPQVVLGLGPFIAALSAGWQFTTAPDSTRGFVDEVSSLAGAAGGDTLQELKAVLAYRITDRWIAGALVETDSMWISHTSNDLGALFARHEYGDWKFTAGAGAYHSTTAARGLTVFGQIAFSPDAPLKLR